ncbi:hypothetical protein M3Y97_01027300 [Aphelenchoides bicaudatus]|nr:hypothetical protein M3Y97_01027300 [Aphelenchoides bicaudatus]
MAVYLVYTGFVIVFAVFINGYVAAHVYTGSTCSTHVILVSTLTGILAYWEMLTCYFIYEVFTYLCIYVLPTQSKKQRAETTRQNTLFNSKTEEVKPNKAEQRAKLRLHEDKEAIDLPLLPSTSKAKTAIRPAVKGIGTLAQVSSSWEQHTNRQKLKAANAVKFDNEALLLKARRINNFQDPNRLQVGSARYSKRPILDPLQLPPLIPSNKTPILNPNQTYLGKTPILNPTQVLPTKTPILNPTQVLPTKTPILNPNQPPLENIAPETSQFQPKSLVSDSGRILPSNTPILNPNQPPLQSIAPEASQFQRRRPTLDPIQCAMFKKTMPDSKYFQARKSCSRVYAS